MKIFGFDLSLKRSTGLDDERHWRVMGGDMKTGAGVTIGAENVMSVTAVFACVRNVSEDIGKLPLILYRNAPGGGKERATDSPLFELLRHTPNSEMSALSFRQTLTAHAMIWPGGYAWIQRDQIGRPVALWPLRPDRVKMKRRNGKLGAIYFTLTDDTGHAEDYEDSEIFHIEGLGFDGLRGYSTAVKMKETFGLTKALDQFAASFFGNGTTVSGVLEHPTTLKDKSIRDELRKSWEEIHQGPNNAHKIAILQEGMKFASTSIEPNKAQSLESRQFQVDEVCRIFRVPPHKVQNLLRATNNNIEHQGLEYVTDTLGAWLVRWEQEIRRKLITDPALFAEHLVDALLRGDTTARFAAYNLALSQGWMTRDEVRGRENLNPLPNKEGTIVLVPVNFTTMEKLIAAPMPTAKPADPAAREAPPAGATRSRVMRPVFADVIGRMIRKESLAARKASKKPGEFGQWVTDFYADHGVIVRDALAAGMDADAEIRDGPNFNRQRSADATQEAAKRHCEASANQLRSTFTMGHADGLEARVGKLCDGWEQTRAGEFADTLLKEKP